MKLSVEDVAKLTGLSASTVRQYAWERKIGKIEGRSRVFTMAEARKLGGSKGSTKKSTKRSGKAGAKARVSPKKAAPPALKNELPQTEPSWQKGKRHRSGRFLASARNRNRR